MKRFMARTQQRVMLGIGRAVLNLVSDALRLQEVQISLLEGEVRDGVERVQQYGLTAHPHPGAECVAVFIGGNRDHGLVIAIDDRRHRVRELAEGEVCLYTDEDADGGHRIILRRDRKIEILAAELTITAPIVTIVGDVTLQGDLEVEGDIHATGTVFDDDGNTNHHSHA